MSCFIGVSIQQSITDNIYQSALSQIEDFISETSYQIIPHNTILMIGSRYQKFCLPKNSQYLYSNLQHFMVSQADDQEFVETVVECLMILKQHFPHKIQIQMVSDLEQIYNLKVKIQQQIPRRLISHLKILYDRCKKAGLTQQQLHMLISNVAADFHKDYKQKIKNMSLKILAEAKVQSKLWNSLSKEQIKIIDEVVNQPIHQKVGIEVLQKIVRNNDYKDLSFPYSGKKQNIEPNSNSNTSSFVEDLAIPDYDGPFDPMTALFQLKESLSISRISWIIQHIDPQKLSEKKIAKFDARIKEVIQKFLTDFYPDVPTSHLNFFSHSLAQYQMRRSNLSWDGLVEEVLLKIEEKQKQTSKGKSRLKSSMMKKE